MTIPDAQVKERWRGKTKSLRLLGQPNDHHLLVRKHGPKRLSQSGCSASLPLFAQARLIHAAQLPGIQLDFTEGKLSGQVASHAKLGGFTPVIFHAILSLT